MTIKKKLKTKLDYQIRTFSICAFLLAFFTLFIVIPKTNQIKVENEKIMTQIEESSIENATLRNKFDSLISDIKIMLND